MIDELKRRFDTWRRLGTRKDAGGSEVIAHTPRKFPQAYLHAVFAPKDASAWQQYFQPLPHDLVLLYRESNGLKMFSELSIYGIRSHFQRDDSATFQPFDLRTHQAEETLRHHAGHLVFFGGYRSDGASVAMGFDSPAVLVYVRSRHKPVMEWPDVRTFLLSEFDRLQALHDDEGYPTASLVPDTRAEPVDPDQRP